MRTRQGAQLFCSFARCVRWVRAPRMRAHQARERKLANQKLGRPLVLSDFSQRHCARSAYVMGEACDASGRPRDSRPGYIDRTHLNRCGLRAAAAAPPPPAAAAAQGARLSGRSTGFPRCACASYLQLGLWPAGCPAGHPHGECGVASSGRCPLRRRPLVHPHSVLAAPTAEKSFRRREARLLRAFRATHFGAFAAPVDDIWRRPRAVGTPRILCTANSYSYSSLNETSYEGLCAVKRHAANPQLS